ncbi:MAG: hypothetical protein IPO27_04840 [Bacteroidetes bacterium]|nr:hypothetical protein [Bacteroidota bacterium]
MDEQNKNLEEEKYVEKEKTFLQKALGLPLIGEYITTAVGIIPAFIYFIIVWIVFDSDSSDKYMSYHIFIIVLLTYIWLIFLERKGKVKICTPIIPIPIKWLLIPLVLLSFYGLFFK